MAVVDASIPLQAQLPQLMSPMQAAQGALNLRDLQAQTQLRQMQVMQGQQTLRDQQELSALAASRDNIDPATGGFTAEAIAQINNPMLRQKLNNDRMNTLKLGEEIKYKASQAGQEADKRKTDAIHGVMESAYSAYEDVLKKTGNVQAATDKFNQVQADGYQEIRDTGRGGFSKDQQFRLLTPDDVGAKLITHKERMEEENKARIRDAAEMSPFMKETKYLQQLKGKLADLRPTDPASNQLRQEIAQVQRHIAKLDAPTSTEIKMMMPQGQGTTPVAVPSTGTLAQQAAGKLGMTPDGLDIQAWNFINTGKLPYRKGTGGGADRNDLLVRRAGEIAQQLGMSPQELASLPATKKADAQSLGTQVKALDAIEAQLNSFHNNLDTWNSLAQGIAPKLGGDKVRALAKDLKKVNFTGVRSIDDMKMRIEQEFNDPTTSAVAVAAMSAAMDYGRIMQGPQSAASLTEGSKKEAERLINAAADEKGRRGIMAALESDAEGQVKGKRDQVDKIRGRLTGRTVTPEKTTVPNPMLQPKKISSDAEYNALPSGAEYIAPDGSHRRKK